jgi:hypothetical protein
MVTEVGGAPPPPRECAVDSRGGGEAQVFCMRDMFILNEICAQDKICTLGGTLLG